MSLQDRIINHFSDSIQTQQESMASLCGLIEYASQCLVTTLLNDKKIFTCGNGRSATNAQALSSLMVNQFERDRPSLPVIALTADTAIITAIANDFQFNEVFSKQLRALGQSGDMLIAFTDGNNSANIANAIAVAHEKDISIIALTGNNGGIIAPLLRETDIEIRVPSNSSARIQETHILITHCLCDLIDYQLFG